MLHIERLEKVSRRLLCAVLTLLPAATSMRPASVAAVPMPLPNRTSAVDLVTSASWALSERDAEQFSLHFAENAALRLPDVSYRGRTEVHAYASKFISDCAGCAVHTSSAVELRGNGLAIVKSYLVVIRVADFVRPRTAPVPVLHSKVEDEISLDMSNSLLISKRTVSQVVSQPLPW